MYLYDTIQSTFFGRYFSDYQEIYESDKPQFLFLLQKHIDLDEKLSLLPFGSTFIHQRADPVNTLLMPFYGHPSFSGFFLSQQILSFWYSFTIPDIFVSSADLTKSQMLLSLHVLSRISSMTSSLFSLSLLTLPNRFVRLSILPKQI